MSLDSSFFFSRYFVFAGVYFKSTSENKQFMKHEQKNFNKKKEEEEAHKPLKLKPIILFISFSQTKCDAMVHISAHTFIIRLNFIFSAKKRRGRIFFFIKKKKKKFSSQRVFLLITSKIKEKKMKKKKKK